MYTQSVIRLFVKKRALYTTDTEMKTPLANFKGLF